MEDDHFLDSRIGEGLVITEASKVYLRETAKWAKFLAIVGFVFMGLIILIGLLAGSLMGAMTSSMTDSPGMGALGAFDTGALGLFYIIFALIYFFPTLYLYRFATRTKQALLSEDSEGMTLALEQLKSCFKFMGILMIVVLAFYALGFLFVIIFGMAAAL